MILPSSNQRPMIIAEAEVCHILDPNYDPTFY
jgi:hypothetical protein